MSVSVNELAQRLEHDIRSRGLAPGHRYLTGEESARLLGTSIATANRALQVLAERDLVVRRRASGTFVGPAMTRTDVTNVRTVSILVPASEKSYSTLRLDPLVEGLLSNMNDVSDVRVSYVPSDGDVDFVRSLLEPVSASGQLAGVVAVSCSYDVYRYLGDSEYPLVVMGSLYPGQSHPSIDTDERQAGYLLANYLIERGHRRLAMLSNSETCPGDHHFHDGVSEALTEAKMPHNALVLRAPGPNLAVLRGQVTELMQMAERPTGVMVRLPRWADEVATLVRSHGLDVPKDVEVVFKAFAGGEINNSGFSHVRPSMPYREMAQLVGRMLSQSRQRLPLEQRTVVLSYEMCRMAGEAKV